MNFLKNTMVGAQGSDVLEGGEDDNRLFGGGAGNVDLIGDAGADTYHIRTTSV